jgi:hypothetical protein
MLNVRNRIREGQTPVPDQIRLVGQIGHSADHVETYVWPLAASSTEEVTVHVNVSDQDGDRPIPVAVGIGTGAIEVRLAEPVMVYLRIAQPIELPQDSLARAGDSIKLGGDLLLKSHHCRVHAHGM